MYNSRDALPYPSDRFNLIKRRKLSCINDKAARLLSVNWGPRQKNDGCSRFWRGYLETLGLETFVLKALGRGSGVSKLS